MRFSIEAEQAVIGALMLDPAKTDEALEIVQESDFYNSDNRAIFKNIVSLSARGVTSDIVTLAEEMHSVGQLESIGGLGHLVELAQNTPTAANLKSYCHIVADRAIERRIVEAGNSISSLGLDESIAVDAKLEALHSEISNLERRDSAEVVNFDQLLKARIVELDEKFHDRKPRGMMTGFDALDERYKGIPSVAMWVLAARPGQGKTALALNLAYNQARQGKEVLIFSLEMGKDELTDRLICAASGIESGKIRSGKLIDADWVNLTASIAKLKGLKIHIIDIPSIDIHRAKAIVRKFNRVNPLGLIVIDYLQLMKDHKAKSRFDEVSSVSREIKAMAKTTGCPVLALSQLNRGVEKQANKRPSMADLRESGQIEQDADIITFIYRDEYYNEDSPNKGMAELITGKFREGEVGTDILGSQLQYARFVNLDFHRYNFETETENTRKSF